MRRAKLALKWEKGRNRLEVEFSKRLAHLRQRGEILWWGYEPLRLCLGKGAWYTPDFGALTREGELVLFETKGFWREAARVRIKVAATHFPFFRFIAVQRVKGEWKEEEFSP